ncbi:ATP-binding protein [Streptomyces luteolus]|uniref:ATP-binding protein n=1 Tax=Streptomyces luteolus TaxID=3043615 RepID=A0ABT6T063_9ACTN|nr:ATP-binding protein [Streptomyces sp. B-S-A12]MDI3421252.1 ATP-binding protein [Streptomyces sp. B-S-A12]
MNSEIEQRIAQLSTPARHFTVLLSPTPRGARLARRLAVAHFTEWGCHVDSVHAAEQVVAELANNAALHGRVRGRDFRLRLGLSGGTLRVEVTDARYELGVRDVDTSPDPYAEGGRGLLIVGAFARRWGVAPEAAPSKTVWAEIE